MTQTKTDTSLYLDLLKQALTRAAFPEHYRPWQPRTPWKRRIVRTANGLLRRGGVELVRPVHVDPRVRQQGGDWPADAETMIGLTRLDNLQDCIERALDDDVPGDFIETGVWRGGACIFMRGVLKAHDITDRAVWLADSFAGLPPPDPRYPADDGDPLHAAPELAISLADVQANFRRYGLLDEQVQFLEGWFEDTLPHAPVDRLAILRLDGDMYGSTIVALQALAPKVSEGGFIIIDDYNLPGARRAVHDYRNALGITAPIDPIDDNGAFWRVTQRP